MKFQKLSWKHIQVKLKVLPFVVPRVRIRPPQSLVVLSVSTGSSARTTFTSRKQ